MSASKHFMNYQTTKLIVILGSTAVGKTKLSIELAKRFNGEIISADSMQVYKGLDIITNKVTAEEQAQVPHHLIDVVSPLEEFTVLDFKSKALDAIHHLTEQNKIPVVVGGTNYFIEALLWDFLIDDGKGDIKQELQNRKEFNYSGMKRKHPGDDDVGESNETKEKQSLYDQLMKVDPERANQLHPNNLRKISRSLQIFHTTGQTHSSLMKEQQDKTGSSTISGPLRFRNSLVFWLTAKQEVLDERISKRVDEMVGRGLVNEIRNFYENHVIKKDKNTAAEMKSEDNSEGSTTNESFSKENTGLDLNPENDAKTDDRSVNMQLSKSYEEGLFQAIGFKEFHLFLTYQGDDEKEKEKLLQLSLTKLKQITSRYSKKQVRWVQNRFLGRPEKNALPVYNLDTSDIEQWDLDVLEKAVNITSCFLNNERISIEPYRINIDDRSDIDKHRKHVCGVCNDRIIIGDDAWNVHLKSKRHRKIKASKKAKEG